MVPNPEEALQVLREFRGLLDANRAIHRNASVPHGTRNPASTDPSHSELQRLEPLVEEIARSLEDDPARHRPPSPGMWVAGMWHWRTRPAWVERLIGILESQDRRDAIFTPVGPRLSASRFHQWVWNAAKDLWDNGHYREAVQAAATAVERQTQLKLGCDVSGANLYSDAFSLQSRPSERRLRLPHVEATAPDGTATQGWKSAHEGAAFFGRGCSMGIRNLVSHNIDPLPEQVGMEYLAALSVLARWVDEATVEQD